MDIYTAVLRAADHIERNPHLFDFNACGTPARTDCGTPACALGWIGHFLGIVPKTQELRSVADALGFGDCGLGFYERMDEVYGSYEWMISAAACAKGLRLYAARYLSPPKAVVPAGYWDRMAERLAAETDVSANRRSVADGAVVIER